MGEQVEKQPEEKKPEEEKKEEEVAKPEEKEAAEELKDAPTPPPKEIVLRVFMHCEGCARKVRRCLRGFDGVEDIQTDCKTHKVVVKGEKADPIKVLERIQKKSHRQVELLSPIPNLPAANEPKVEEKEAPKPEEKKEEPPQVITVVLKVNMHCEACAQVIRKRILRMKGIENVETDLKNSQVTVKGTIDATKLVDFIHKRTGKQAVVVKQDPEPKKEDEKGKEEKKDGGEVKKQAEDNKKAAGDNPTAAAAAATVNGGGDGDGKEKEKKKEEEKSSGGSDGVGGGGDGGEAVVDGGPGGGGVEDMKVIELSKNEYNYYYYNPLNYQIYPARYSTAEMAYGYPPAPQMFSDENPNACSVM